MMRRLLIVSPHFPPVNAPDMQRVRQSLPYLAENGWEAEVLAVDPNDVTAPIDAAAQGLPETVRVHRVRAPRNVIEALAGSSTLGRRARRAFAAAGPEIIRGGGFDLALFSTTQFSTLRLGPGWKRAHDLDYVIDWQDPWLKFQPGGDRPGGWRYAWAQREAEKHEPECVHHCAGMLATNQRYLEELLKRYPASRGIPFAAIPFGFEPADFDVARARPDDSRTAPTEAIRVLYVGAVGGIMRDAVTLLLRGAKAAAERQPALRRALRLVFVGTSYAPTGQASKTVMPIAQREGVADMVEEHPARIAYHASLRAMLEADALLLLGSEDPNYVPSKLATVAMAGKPALAVVHRGSELETQLEKLGCATIARVGETAAGDVATVAEFLVTRPSRLAREEQLQALTARARTRELCALLDRACGGKTAK
jgi:hypothetical protein